MNFRLSKSVKLLNTTVPWYTLCEYIQKKIFNQTLTVHHNSKSVELANYKREFSAIYIQHWPEFSKETLYSGCYTITSQDKKN